MSEDEDTVVDPFEEFENDLLKHDGQILGFKVLCAGLNESAVAPVGGSA